MNRDFKEIVDILERKYFCPDLSFEYYDIDEVQMAKTKFYEEDLHFEVNQSENLENGYLMIPNFYEEPINLPASGTKFIRSRIDFYCGDLAHVTCEIGYWRLKPHDLQHRDYVITDKNTVYFAFWRDENKWSMLNAKDWNKRKEELDEDLSNPILRQMELDFYHLLNETVQSRTDYVTLLLKKDAKRLIENLKKLKWFLKNVPMFWSALKIYSQDMYDQVINRLDDIYINTLENAEFYINEQEESDVIANEEDMRVLDDALKPILLEGHEIIDEMVFANVLRMYTERQQTDRFANLETLSEYKKIALDIYHKNLLKYGIQVDSFVWFRDVLNKLN